MTWSSPLSPRLSPSSSFSFSSVSILGQVSFLVISSHRSQVRAAPRIMNGENRESGRLKPPPIHRCGCCTRFATMPPEVGTAQRRSFLPCPLTCSACRPSAHFFNNSSKLFAHRFFQILANRERYSSLIFLSWNATVFKNCCIRRDSCWIDSSCCK